MGDWQIRQLNRLVEFGEKHFRLDKHDEYPLLYVDEAFCRMIGYSRREVQILCRNKASALIYEADLYKVQENVRQGILKDRYYTCRFRMRRKDGEILWVWESGSLYTDENGDDYVRSVVVNVTEEESMRHEMAATYNNIPGGVLKLLISQNNFYVTEANDQYFEMVGSTREEYIGSSGMFTFPEDLPGLRSHLLRQAAEKKPVDYEFRAYSDKEERFRWYRVLGRYSSEAEDGAEYMAILLDISKRRKAMFQLETEKERYRVALVNNGRQGKEKQNEELADIYQFYMDKLFEFMLIVRVSDGAIQKYFQGDIVTEEEFPGEKFQNFVQFMAMQYVHPEDRQHFLDFMKLPRMIGILQSSKLEETILIRMRWEENEYHYTCVRYSYFGGQEQIIVSAQNAHFLKEAQEKEEQANRRVMREVMHDAHGMMEMRRNFMSMLSRELRSPLEYIRFTLQRMNNLPGDELLSAVRYMSNVVDIITMYDKLENGQIRLEIKQFVLGDMLYKCMEYWKERAEFLGIQFQYNVNLQWQHYLGDEDKLRQIVNHVIGNCMMSSKQGETVEVWIDDLMQSDSTGKLVITAEDRGFPVTDGSFGRSYPVDVRDNEKEWKNHDAKSETAFSLIVARKLVEMMDGRMTLTRKSGNSNELKIEIMLPKTKGAETNIDVYEENEAKKQEPLRGYSLMLVKHLKKEGEMTAGTLQLSGAKADVARGGMEALRIIKNYDGGALDAILIEANLGDMDYLEFTEMLRAETWADAGTIPVIALTEEMSQGAVQEGMKTGVNGWLSDPTDLVRLRLILDAIKKGTLEM